MLVAIAGYRCYSAITFLLCQLVSVCYWHIWCNSEHIPRGPGFAPLSSSSLAALLVRHCGSHWFYCWWESSHVCHRYGRSWLPLMWRYLLSKSASAYAFQGHTMLSQDIRQTGYTAQLRRDSRESTNAGALATLHSLLSNKHFAPSADERLLLLVVTAFVPCQ